MSISVSAYANAEHDLAGRGDEGRLYLLYADRRWLHSFPTRRSSDLADNLTHSVGRVAGHKLAQNICGVTHQFDSGWEGSFDTVHDLDHQLGGDDQLVGVE